MDKGGMRERHWFHNPNSLFQRSGNLALNPQLQGFVLKWKVNECAQQVNTMLTLWSGILTGEEVLYTWVEFLREHDELWEPPKAPDQDTCPPDGLGRELREGELEEGEGSDSAEEGWEEGQAAGSGADRFARWQRTSGPGGPASIACPEIVHGEPFTERKSTFQVHTLLESPCSNLPPSSF
jgi:hypothetical protein